jgi:hypothetical protein
MTKNHVVLDPGLVGLIEPSDQPEEQPQPDEDGFAGTKVTHSLGVVRVIFAIVGNCLNGFEFSIGDMLRELSQYRSSPEDRRTVVKLCGKEDDGLKLLRRDGLFLPCRENAAKAVRRLHESDLHAAAKAIGVQDVPALVEAINALPSGLELMARDRQPDTAE